MNDQQDTHEKVLRRRSDIPPAVPPKPKLPPDPYERKVRERQRRPSVANGTIIVFGVIVLILLIILTQYA